MDMLPSIIERVTTSLLHGQNQFRFGRAPAHGYRRDRGLRTQHPDAALGLVSSGQFTLHLTITDECDAFYWFKWWFKKQEYCGRNRNMDTFTSYNAKPPYVLTPAPGRHWFFYNKRPILVHFDRTEEKKGGDSYARRTEKYTIWTFGRKQAFMRGLLDDMVAAHTAAWADKPTLMLWGGSGWFSAPAYTSRTLDSGHIAGQPEGSPAPGYPQVQGVQGMVRVDGHPVPSWLLVLNGRRGRVRHRWSAGYLPTSTAGSTC